MTIHRTLHWTLALACIASAALLGGCPKGDKAPETELNISGTAAMPQATPAAPTPTPAQSPVVIPAGLTESSFTVEGMTCTDCSTSIEATVIKLPGVSTVAADWKGGQVKVQYDETKVKSEEIIAAINKLAFKCTLADAPATATEDKPADGAEEKQGA